MTRFRPTEPEDLASLAELFGSRFGHPLSPAAWEWKYRRLPGEARSRVAVDRGGRVLAHAGALCLPARLREGTAVWQLSDWVGSPAGSGLRPPLVTLGRRLLADLPRPGDADWIFGFPSERHFRLGERVFGYRLLPAVVPWVGELAAAGPDPGRGTGEDLGPGEAARIETSDHCGDWGEEAWTACGAWSVRRSAAFLNWRYHARPDRYYRFYRMRRDGAPASPDGLAVFAFVGRLARGAELWLPPAAPGAPRPESWEPALRAVAGDLTSAGLARWELWPPPPGSGLEPLFRELGLRPAGEPVFMGCRGRRGSTTGPSPADPEFYYAMGDYDLV